MQEYTITRGELLERQSQERVAMFHRHAIERYEHQRTCSHEWVARGLSARCSRCRTIMIDGKLVHNG